MTDRTTKPHALAAEVSRLAAEGMSRNRIARELGVSTGTVSSAARIAGVTFDRKSTAAATEAARTDAKKARGDLAADLLVLAATATRRALEIVEDGDDATLRDLVVALGIAADKALKIAAHDANDGRDLSAVDAFNAAMLGEKASDDEPLPGQDTA